MNNLKLKETAARHVPKEHKLQHVIRAFLCGGGLAVMAQFTLTLLNELGIASADASTIIILLVIFLSALFTGIGIYDKAGQFFGAGLFIPISGFANSLASEALERKSEGLIYGIGSNMFKLAGSVITYGIVSAIVFTLIRYGVSLL